MRQSLEKIYFQDRFIKSFPGDLSGNAKTRLTENVLYSLVTPTSVKAPEILLWSEEVAQVLEISSAQSPQSIEAQILSGNRILPSMKPYATRYGGYQFGHWAGQLGDGRAITLGEIVNSFEQRFEIQLKGAGPTPYSRQADGRAVLRSSVREFLCSESLHHLGIPTTRALSCVLTGEAVIRDMFYDGHPQREPGAIVTRVAPTFLRFGHFEILAAHGEKDLLKKLIEFVLLNHSLGLDLTKPQVFAEQVAQWFTALCQRTAELIVHWQRVGFVHGVMNTDNMSILGLTIDYGPYGWLDAYDPEWTPNTTDAGTRRYRFSEQPAIAFWNLNRLAEALSVAVDVPISEWEKSLEVYRDHFNQEYRKMKARKVGWEKIENADDEKLLTELDTLLQGTEVDMTLFYRELGHFVKKSQEQSDLDLHAGFMESLNIFCYSEAPPENWIFSIRLWLQKYLQRSAQKEISVAQQLQKINSTNPYFILRNYLVQQALEKFQEGSRTELEELFQALKTPYEKNNMTEKFYTKRPEWARNKPGSSMLSCSS